MKEQQKQEGIILYIVLLVVSIFMAVVLTLTGVSISQTKITLQAGDSVKAFVAADTGVEQALYNIRNKEPLDTSDIPVTGLGNGSNYTVDITIIGPTTATIQSKGEFKKSRRTIEAKY